MPPVRIGFVKYLNTLPLVDGLESCRDLELVAAAPSRLAPMLRAGEVDLALASIVDAGGPEPLEAVPCGMIGCDGPTLTVRLYSRVPWASVTTLFADTDSHTSVVLARLILARLHGNTRALVRDFDARERIAPGHAHIGEWPETLLLIGDKVVADAPPAGLYPHELDLGEAWHALTGLPFVYAAWMSRPGEPHTRPELAHAALLLDRQRRRNALRLDRLIANHAHARGWSRQQATHYLRDLLRYQPTRPAMTGAQRFIDDAAALGLLAPHTLTWTGLARPAAAAAPA